MYIKREKGSKEGGWGGVRRVVRGGSEENCWRGSKRNC
jgi:hypothetical protein